MPSRDASRPARPAGSPRDIDMGTLNGFPYPRCFAAGAAGRLPTRNRGLGDIAEEGRKAGTVRQEHDPCL